jgi:hypothetical protein
MRAATRGTDEMFRPSRDAEPFLSPDPHELMRSIPADLTFGQGRRRRGTEMTTCPARRP